MFHVKNNPDFFPTPVEVIDQMLYGVDIAGRVILEPSGGIGHIVDYLYQHGAKEVISCEKDQNLKKILQTKCKVIADDFMTVSSDKISHIDCIIGNPPFSADEKHINHAFEIAPAGCEIVMLCNYESYNRPYTTFRQQFKSIIEQYGTIANLGECFDSAERKTNVKIGLVKIKKGGAKEDEFSGFFMEEDPQELQANGIMPYNLVRDLVNRYVAACKLFEKQVELGVQMNQLTSTFFSSKLAFTAEKDKAPYLYNDFKKDLQKSAWGWVFDKLNMKKYTTRGLMEDINKFVEKQTDVPFTMRNIYKMIEIVVGTHSGRMDKALEEVFDKLTEHYHENRMNVEGWKTNSHYLVNRKFIMPYLSAIGWSGQLEIRDYQNSNYALIEDMVKALCFLTGKNYDDIPALSTYVRCRYHIKRNGEVLTGYGNFFSDRKDAEKRKNELGADAEIEDNGAEWGKWFDWSFFQIRCYKKGTCHMVFKDEDVWGLFNREVSRIKGFPLFEANKRTEKKTAKKAA